MRVPHARNRLNIKETPSCGKNFSCFTLYIAIVLTPVVLAATFGKLSNSDPFYAIGKNTALIGFMILALQPVLAARLKWIERYCGKMLGDRAFYICGPKGMLTAVIKTLRNLGVPKGKIHHELFAFPN